MFEYIGYVMHTINIIPNDNSFVIIKCDDNTYKVLMNKPFSQTTLFVYKLDNINLDVRYTIDRTDEIYKDIDYVFNNINYYYHKDSKKVEVPNIYFSKISRYYVGYNSIAYSIEIDEKLRNIHNNIINNRN